MFNVNAVNSIELINRMYVPFIDEFSNNFCLNVLVFLINFIYNLINTAHVLKGIESAYHEFAFLHQLIYELSDEIQVVLVHQIVRYFDHNLFNETTVQSLEGRHQLGITMFT